MTRKNLEIFLLKIFITIQLILPIFLVFTEVSFAQPLPTDLGIESESWVLMDAVSGQILYSQDEDKPGVFPASTTKIMTAIVALENGSLDQIMIASQEAVYDIGDGGMNIGIMAGEEIYFTDLLNAMLVCSANEAANIIAENIAPTREDFISMMNNRAKELGALNTNFVNTCGIHDANHSTTANDMAIIARHAMSIPAFREIVKKTYYDMPETNKHKNWNTLYTTNKFLTQNLGSESTYKIIGIKTGFTTPAGHNLITAATDDKGMELISVMLGVKNEKSWENVYFYTQKLLDFGFENFSPRNIIEANTHVYKTKVENAEEDLSLGLVTEKDVECVLPLGIEDLDSLNIHSKLHIKPLIKAPIKLNEVLGYIEFFRDDTFLGKTNVIADTSIEEIKSIEVTKKLKNVINLIRTNSLVKILIKLTYAVLIVLVLRLILKKISRRARKV